MEENSNNKDNIDEKKKLSTYKKVLLLAISMTIVFIIVFLGSSYLYVRGKIYSEPSEIGVNNNEYDLDEYEEIEVDYHIVDGITNVLLLGTDGRNLDENSRADAIIIASLDNNNKNVKLVSLFRDTLVNIPGYGEAKINSAMQIGGVQLLMDTIAQTYGIRIDKYLTVNFWGFEEIINQIGGIEVDIKDYQLNELNKYIGEVTGGNDCPVTQTGIQTLNGKQALSYARIRKGVGDDYERTDRQREVITKIGEKIKETKPSKYLGIMNNMLGYIKTNIEPLEALDLAYSVYKLPGLEIEQLQIPIVDLASDMTYKNLGSVLVMDRAQNSQILQNFIFNNEMVDKENLDYYSFNSAIQVFKDAQAIYKGNNTSSNNNNNNSLGEQEKPNEEDTNEDNEWDGDNTTGEEEAPNTDDEITGEGEESGGDSVTGGEEQPEGDNTTEDEEDNEDNITGEEEPNGENTTEGEEKPEIDNTTEN